MEEGSVFRFSEINIEQSESVHKVGTDALVLAAEAYYAEAKRILDIGTGTGILALVMAQKHPNAIVDALEIEQAAAELAHQNIAKSEFHKRCKAHHMDLAGYCTPKTIGTYDLIVSNPPYFSGQSTHAPNRSLARQDATLPPILLFQSAKQLLSERGQLWLVLPTERLQLYYQTACLCGLYFNMEMVIFSKRNPVDSLQLIPRCIAVYSTNPIDFKRKTLFWQQNPPLKMESPLDSNI
jgi:tRNA1Val (adenine37-N6)-methyltransferase